MIFSNFQQINLQPFSEKKSPESIIRPEFFYLLLGAPVTRTWFAYIFPIGIFLDTSRCVPKPRELVSISFPQHFAIQKLIQHLMTISIHKRMKYFPSVLVYEHSKQKYCHISTIPTKQYIYIYIYIYTYIHIYIYIYIYILLFSLSIYPGGLFIRGTPEDYNLWVHWDTIQP